MVRNSLPGLKAFWETRMQKKKKIVMVRIFTVDINYTFARTSLGH